jgi:hypothetical protein
LCEEQRYQIRCAVHADAGDKGEHRAKGEIAVTEGAQVDDRLVVGQYAPEEQSATDDRDGDRATDRRVVEPIPAWAFMERIFEAAEKDCHQQHPDQVEMAQK